MTSIGEALATASQHHQAGRLQAAEQVCRQILSVAPDQPGAWLLLGVVYGEAGNPQAAAGCIRRAWR